MNTIYPHFHFRPKNNWLNDPNGTIYHNGYYHIFYQYNPTSDCWGNLHWGHARTKDFINYEVIPNNLYPQKDLGETDCFSGCIALNKDKVPVALYTSVALEDDNIANVQKAVFFDDNIINFEEKRIDALTIDMKDLPPIRNDWRDPYVFCADNRYFLVLGAAIGDLQNPSVLLFESEDGSLTNWKYVKEIIAFKPVIELFECPNFFKLGDKWVLVGSPYKEVEYYLGTFDTNTLDFVVEKKGLIDHCAQYYATNTILDDKNRTILFAFERGFSKNQGWNNVISIPREISLDEDNEIIQNPIEEISLLREEKIIDNISFDLESIEEFSDNRFAQCEINFKIELENNLKTNLILKDNKESLTQILFSNSNVKFDSIFIPFKKQNTYDIKLFIDHSILEIYIDNGRHCATRVIESLKNINSLQFRGNCKISDFSIYKMSDLNISE
ncbi:MAG: glycoside hydrolase family 32 protein [Sphaerochaetaceae bacterium]|nr:glycoside hydrolase family 32 protein [Sphaerochaetaceae bacterium]MDC7238300.1 glycoside hydrolase family 32 protein [Sphaerochaetaceae bacterium]